MGKGGLTWIPLSTEVLLAAFKDLVEIHQELKTLSCEGLGIPQNMFADENGDVAVAEPDLSLDDLLNDIDTSLAGIPAEEETDDKKAPEGTIAWPDFICDIDNIYRANRSHIFTLHGNVNDYPDNTGVRGDLRMTLFTRYDSFWLKERLAKEAENGGTIPLQPIVTNSQAPVNIAAYYSIPNGLVFATQESFGKFADILRSEQPDLSDDELRPSDLAGTLMLLNSYFKLSARRFAQNQPLRAKLRDKTVSTLKKSQAMAELTGRPEVNLTVVFYDAKMCFPQGNVGTLTMDRTPIAFLENWALDGSIACRNKIVLVAQRVTDLQESLRSGDSRVSSIRIKRPDLADRKEWIKNFRNYIFTTPALVNGKPREDINTADDITPDILANNTAGMSRVQIEGVFMESWLHDEPVGIQMIADHKKKALDAEYGDILDVEQGDIVSLCPEVKGKPEDVQRAAIWSLLGGHELLKKYAEDWIIDPMLLGDRRRTSRGVLLNGPPGTGKTHYARLLALLCRVNFINADFSKLFGGIVGETEAKTERFFEAVDAMAPCLVFCDEIDSVFSNGRQSGGDSGVQARMFNKVMKWLSDDARWGKVVVVMASNRPDLLDSAFIREGRIDDRLPALPPHPKDVKARKSLLGAVCKKGGIRLNKSLASTMSNADDGLGKLLFDKRIWTGAEYERLVKLAFGNAAQRATEEAKKKAAEQKLNRRDSIEFIRTETKNPLIELEDWNRALKAYRPNTRQANQQIDLALEFCNNLEYVPEQWHARFEEVEQTKSSTGESASDYALAAQSYDRD